MADLRLLQQQNIVMIIDDETDIVIIIRMSLEKNGFQVDSYTDLMLAFQNFEDGIYDRDPRHQDARS